MAIKSLVARGWQGVAKYIQALEPTLVTLTGTQTLTNKSITSPDNLWGSVSHSYGSAAADWTLSAAEMKARHITVTAASGAVNAIATPTVGREYVILNTSGQALTFKAAGQTGVTIASTKSAIVRANAAGTDFIRVTADS